LLFLFRVLLAAGMLLFACSQLDLSCLPQGEDASGRHFGDDAGALSARRANLHQHRRE
jgi:hypothetical protein